MADEGPGKVVAQIPGVCLKWISSATPEFRRRQLDLDRYSITVVEQRQSATIVLTSLDSAPDARGNTGSNPAYEVEVSKKDLKVLRSNYVR